ncbi:MAG: hypothetical protein Q8L52_01860 [bacterium]|nr:hypothetical protein [bacterium]
MEGKLNKIERPRVALENVKTPEDFLNAIDFQTLNEIFTKLAQKSGKDNPVWIDKSIIQIDTEIGNSGENGRTPGKTINGEVILYWESILQAEIPFPFEAAHVLIHELVHITARQMSVIDRGVSEDIRDLGVLVSNGLFETVTPLGENEDKGTAFAYYLNEAVTEQIAGEVMSEYLRRTGNGALFRTVNNGKDDAYDVERIFLDAVIDSLAERLEVSRDTVWRGFVQMYLNGSQSTQNLVLKISEELGGDKDGRKVLQLFKRLSGTIKKEETLTMAKHDEMLDDLQRNISYLKDSALRVVNRFSPEQLHDSLGLK